MNKKISNALFCLTVALILTPMFVVSIFLYPFSANIYLIRFLITLVLGIGIWQFIRNPNIYANFFKRTNYLIWLLLIIILAWFISAMINHTVFISLWSTAERGVGLITWIYLTILVVILSVNINKHEKWLTLFKVSTAASIVVIILATLSYFGLYLDKTFYHTRLTGTFGNPLFLASYLLIHFFITGYLLLDEYKDNGKWNWVYIALGTIQLIGIIWSGSRGTLLALVIGVVSLLIIYYITAKNNFIKRSALVLLIGLSCLMVLILSLKNIPTIKNNLILGRFVNFSLSKDASFQSRMINSQIALKAFKQKPIFGWGPENYFEAFITNYNKEFQKIDPGELVFDRVHNMPMEILATGGLLLAIPYTIFYLVIFLIIYKIWKADENNNYPILFFAACFLSYFISNIFLFDTPISLLFLFIILAYLLSLYLNQIKNSEEILHQISYKNFSNICPRNILIITTISICILILNCETTFKQFLSSRYFGLANYYITGGKTVETVKYLQLAQGLSPYISKDGIRVGKVDVATYGASFSNDDHDKIVHILINIANKTVPYWKNTGGMLDYHRATLYNNLINPTKEELLIAEGILFSLTKQYPDYIPYTNGLTETYALEEKYKEAIIEADKIITFTDYYSDPYWYKGVSLSALGDQEQAFQNLYAALEKGYMVDKDNLNNLIKLAVILNRKIELPILYKTAISLDSSNIQLYASLATAYQKIGDYDNARITAQKMLELDPSLKPQVDAFLKTLPTE